MLASLPRIYCPAVRARLDLLLSELRPHWNLVLPHSMSGIGGSGISGALMRQIISIIYGVLLIAIWICVIGIVIAVFDSGGPNWLLLVGAFVAAVSTVALAEEFVEWHRHSEASPVQREL